MFSKANSLSEVAEEGHRRSWICDGWRRCFSFMRTLQIAGDMDRLDLNFGFALEFWGRS
jgi:hypothetical protein